MRLLHAGVRSQVWRVSTDDGRRFALKRWARFDWNPTTADLHSRLSHPAIVPLLAHWTDDQHAYQLMPLYAADAQQQPPSPERAPAWITRMAQGLLVLHARGWAHNDLWPGNVLVDAVGNPILTDFDCATPFGERTLAASPLYAAPEALRNAPAAAAQDVYALGVIFHEWLAGQHPYARLPVPQVVRWVFEKPLPPIDPRWNEIIAAMTHKDPAQRISLEVVLSTLKNERNPPRL